MRILTRTRAVIALCLLLLPAIGLAQLPSVDELERDWNTIHTDGVCSSGTPYQFYAKPSNSSAELLIYFNGGGGCWFGQACDLNSEPNIHTPFAEMPGNNPANAKGIFDFEATANPFADYDIVVLPYCTGDVHIGGGEREYNYTTPGGERVSVTTQHKGYDNSQEVMDWVYQNFPSPERIVVSGSSAGAIGASFFAGGIAENYSDVDTVLIADAAGGYASPGISAAMSAWDVASVLPDWDEYQGKDNSNLTFEDFYIASANHNPNLRIAQYNTAEDAVQINFTQVMGDDPANFSLPQRLFNNYLVIESGVDEFHSYTAGGDVHTIMLSPLFYEYEVEGVGFHDWVAQLVSGADVADISCTREERGCSHAPGD